MEDSPMTYLDIGIQAESRPTLFMELERAQDPGLSHPAFLNFCALRPRSERSTSILLGGGSNHASPWDAHYDKVLTCYELL